MVKNYKIYSYFVCGFSVLALAFAYGLEFFDIFPCRLCIYQRYIYYGLILFTLSILYSVDKLDEKYLQFLEWVVYCLLVIGIAIGIFQFLVEKHIIYYESSCTATVGSISSPEQLLSSINAKDLVACDVPQIEIFNLSLSGWNVLYMLMILCISLIIMYKKGKTE